MDNYTVINMNSQFYGPMEDMVQDIVGYFMGYNGIFHGDTRYNGDI